MSLDKQFQAAVDIVQKLPKDGPVSTTNTQKLRFYSLYKQATIGDVNTERPGIFSFVERAKWDAWKSVEGTATKRAKELYINELLEMIDKIGEEVRIPEWLNSPSLDPSVKTNMQFLGVQVD